MSLDASQESQIIANAKEEAKKKLEAEYLAESENFTNKYFQEKNPESGGSSEVKTVEQQQEDFTYSGVSEGFGDSHGKEEITENEKENKFELEGKKVAKELSEVWSKLPEGIRKTSEFSSIYDFGENIGERIFENEMEIIDESVKKNNLSDQERDELIKNSVEIVKEFKNKAEKSLEDYVKENAKIGEWVESNKKKIGEERDQKLSELGDNSIDRFVEPEKKFPEGERKDQRLEDEKGDGFERKVERIDGDDMNKLKVEVEQCRAMYAKIEYDKRSAMDSIRKFFGSKSHEDSAEIISARDQYQKKLECFKNAKIEEFNSRISRGEIKNEDEAKKELRDLVNEFGCMEALNLYNARTDAKAENLMSKKWASKDVVQKIWGGAEKITNYYNKLPLWAKLTISAGTLASGVGFLIGGKRILGGIFTGVGSAKMLDSLHQRSMKKDAGKDAEKLIEKMEKMSKEGKDKKMQIDALDKFLSDKISKVDDQLNKQKLVSIANKFIGIAVGATLGSGILAKVVHGFGGEKGIVGAGYEKFKGIFGMNSETPLADSFEHPNGAPIDVMKESAVPYAEGLATETLTVEKGSSFIGALKHGFLDQHRAEFIKMHPEMAKFDNDQIAFRLAKTYGDQHFNGSLPDYVKEGAKMTFNPKTMEVHFLKPGDVGYFTDPISENMPTDVAPESTDSIPDSIPKVEDVPATKQMVGDAIEQHKADELLEKQKVVTGVQENFATAHTDYVAVADEAMKSGEPSQSAFDEMGRADKIMHQSAEYIKNNTDFYPDTAKKIVSIQKELVGGDRTVWNQLQDLEYDKAAAELPKLEEIRKQLEKEFGAKFTFNPKEGETLRKWTMRVANRLMEKKYNIAN